MLRRVHEQVWWQEVRIEPEGIVLKRLLRTRRLRWADVMRASLTKERSYYTENSSYVRRLVVLKTRDGRAYKVDVSTTAPELEDPEALERAIGEHLPLEEGEVQEWDESRGLLGGLVAFLVLVSVVLVVVWAMGVS